MRCWSRFTLISIHKEWSVYLELAEELNMRILEIVA